MLKEILEKISEYKIYFIEDTFWVAYGDGSGSTTIFPKITKWLTNKKTSVNYDSNVDIIVKYTTYTTPLKSNKGKTVLMYEIPVYPRVSKSYYDKLDIWGGLTTPIKKYYMIVSLGEISVVNFFDKKQEAEAWVRSSS